MTDPLITYLRDHLAGASFAIDLIESLQHQNADEPLGSDLSELLTEVQADRDVLQSLAGRLGSSSNLLKKGAAWLAHRASELKLHRKVAGEFGTFEALEALATGILGKRALWRALATIAATDDRLQGIDYHQLITRAESQHDLVEDHRLTIARRALLGSG